MQITDKLINKEKLSLKKDLTEAKIPAQSLKRLNGQLFRKSSVYKMTVIGKRHLEETLSQEQMGFDNGL